MKKTPFITSVSSALLLLLASTARAQDNSLFYDYPPLPTQLPPPGSFEAPPRPSPPSGPFTRLGERGEVVFSGSSAIGASSTSYAGSQATSWNVTLSPSVDWFVVKNVSIGLDVDAYFGSSTGYSTSTGGLIDEPHSDVLVGPRVGVLLPLSREWSVWPRASFLYEIARGSTEAENGSMAEIHEGAHGFRVGGYVPLVYQPVSNLFFGFGPSVSVPFQRQDYGTRQDVPTSYGATFVLGGFVGGEPSHDAESAPQPQPATARTEHPRAFGDQGEFALTNAIGFSGSYSNDSALPYSSTSFGIEPGFDYFVADDVSLGIDTGFSTSSSNGTNTLGATYSGSNSSFSLGARAGYNVRLGSMASLWLRATLGGSIIPSSATYTFAPNTSSYANYTLSWTDSVAWASLGAPLLVHVAPHAFVGFGPTLYHELSRTSSGPGLTGPEVTTVGGSLIVGGWL